MKAPMGVLRDAFAQDLALAAVLTVVAQVELALADDVEGSRAWHAAGFALVTGAVALRRRAPLAAAAAGAIGITMSTLAGEVPGPVAPLLSLILVTYAVASYSSMRRALAGLAIVVAAILVYPLVARSTFGDELGNLVIFVAIWLLGVAVRRREQRAAIAEAEVARERAEHEAERARAVRDERLRIARELHDVVAHGVSGMVLHAGAARQALTTEPEAAEASLLEVEAAGRQSLGELRTMLTVMRVDDTMPGDLVEAAVERAREAGLAVDARIVWAPEALAAETVLAAGRIVQEAVTNVVRHAQGATRVVIDVEDVGASVRVRVADDGRPSGDPRPGLGLVGMRERAAALGGEVDAGPAEDGGWRVEALLPRGAS
ncbi:sensor histidine kinase [Demequina maris]|uniref:sensor histidine kinase n=1 Tax=Demequina maris TaxID=1638982 RepID=UPI0007845B5F|nr:histidine kinase [Demequina maris]